MKEIQQQLERIAETKRQREKREEEKKIPSILQAIVIAQGITLTELVVKAEREQREHKKEKKEEYRERDKRQQKEKEIVKERKKERRQRSIT